MRRLAFAVLLGGALVIGGCASAPARTPGTYVSQSEPVFLITEAQADQILVDAMNTEFGSNPIVRIEHPNNRPRSSSCSTATRSSPPWLRPGGVRLTARCRTATTSPSRTAAPCRCRE